MSDDIIEMSEEEIRTLRRCYQDLKALASCPVPSVRAAVRVAIAEVHAALNGQGLEYEHYSQAWVDSARR